MTYTLTFGFYTKTVAALKAEAGIRRRKLYEARHMRDANVLVSMLLMFGFLSISTITV